MTIANNRVMTDATGQEILSALQNLAAVQAVPYVASIPTGQWSGSGNDYYITINASNVTANSILIPNYDKNSSDLLNGPIWCVPAAGSFTIHTSAIPSGTVTIMVMFAGTMGEAQYQVLADVYSKSQTDALIAQSTAIEKFSVTFPSSITDLSVRGMNCWYEPGIKKVHISFVIISNSKLIPSRATSGPFAYIPEKYRPKTSKNGSFVFFGKDSTSTTAGKVCPEMTNVMSSGEITANYWVYGEEYSYSAWVDFDYLIE